MPNGLSGAEKMCGVGITFVEDVNGALYVKSLVPGGSAAESGQVQVGDVLMEVGATSLPWTPLHTIVSVFMWQVLPFMCRLLSSLEECRTCILYFHTKPSNPYLKYRWVTC